MLDLISLGAILQLVIKWLKLETIVYGVKHRNILDIHLNASGKKALELDRDNNIQLWKRKSVCIYYLAFMKETNNFIKLSI